MHTAERALNERECLVGLVEGEDEWGKFWDLFGRLVLYELKRFDIVSGSYQEDIFQDLALLLMRNEHQVIRQYLECPRCESFAGLLRVMVRNLAITYLRRHRLWSRITQTTAEAAPFQDETGEWARDPAQNTERSQRLLALLKQVSGSDENTMIYRMLYLRFVDQESVNTIARRLGMKPNTVTQRIRYYIKKLREAQVEELAV